MIRNRKDLAKVKRIVVKVGTSTITYPNCSRNFTRMDHLCRELADLHNQGLEVILVTSGAVAVGSERLGGRKCWTVTAIPIPATRLWNC